MVEMQHDERRPKAPVLVAQLRVAVSWNLDDRASAPNPMPWIGRREECREDRITDAVLAPDVGTECRHPNHRQDRAGDDVPVLVYRDRDHRLDIEDVLRSLFRSEVEIG